jgi:hypothetical protein
LLAPVQRREVRPPAGDKVIDRLGKAEAPLDGRPEVLPGSDATAVEVRKPGQVVVEAMHHGEPSCPDVEDSSAVDERVVQVAQQQRHPLIVHAW